MERIVGRADLESDDSASSSSEDLEETSRSRLLGDFEFIQRANYETVDHGKDIAEDANDEEYEFRLFGAAGNSKSKIRLDSPSLPNAEPGFIQPKRNLGYYFTAPLSTSDIERIQSTALTGDEVLAQARRPWPGCACPWKVLHLPSSASKELPHTERLQLFDKLIGRDHPAKRKRAGKKHRIKLRQQHAKLRAQQDADKAASEVKEAAEREKRTRRNREKKVKKKERDKAKKSAAVVDESAA